MAANSLGAEFPPLVGQDLFDVAHKKKPAAGSLDGWGWRELKGFPLAWFDCLAVILSRIELDGFWPEGLLDAYIAMIPEVDGDCTPLGQRPLCALPVVYRPWASVQQGHLTGWCRSWMPDSVFSAGGGRSSVEAWYSTALEIEEALVDRGDFHVHLFVADVVKAFDTVDRGILDFVLGRLGLPGWFLTAYFTATLMFGCDLSSLVVWDSLGFGTMFIVASYLLWCSYLEAVPGVSPQLYADNLKCVSSSHGARALYGSLTYTLAW